LRWRIALGAYMRSLREAAGLTQTELGEAVGMQNKQMVSGIETGRASVPPDRLAALADALDIDRAELAKRVLRYQDPWSYALLFGLDAHLKAELDAAAPRIGVRRGPKITMREPEAVL